jgi:hypothetical protein
MERGGAGVACIDIFDGFSFLDVAQGDLIVTSAGGDNPLPAGLYIPVITAPRDGKAPLLLCNSTASTVSLGEGGSFERRIVSRRRRRYAKPPRYSVTSST